MRKEGKTAGHGVIVPSQHRKESIASHKCMQAHELVEGGGSWPCLAIFMGESVVESPLNRAGWRRWCNKDPG